MAQQIKTILILGASGDLAARLLLPALGQLLTREPKRRVTLIGAGIDELTDARWKSILKTSFTEGGASAAVVDRVLKNTRYLRLDVTQAGDLTTALEACDGTPAMYFALPPAITARACDALSDVSLPKGTILALEKPFGTDEAGAHALNKKLLSLVPETQVHRIDHFLGVSTVFNLVGLRFANRVFEPVWNSSHIEKVEIVYDEQLALEGRARYYDKAGALVDMIQSHLLQVLAVFAMEPPSSMSAADLRDAKGQVLRATRVYDSNPQQSSRRARYTAGKVGRRSIPSYVDEDGVDPKMGTETLAEITVEIDTWRWARVPFVLRSGKALCDKRREIIVTFKDVPHLPTGLTGLTGPTVLRIYFTPDRLSLELNVNGPGNPEELDRATLTTDLGAGELLPYGEVLAGILNGDPTLSVRGDTAEHCWRIVGPVLEAWHAKGFPMDEYEAGTKGPSNWDGD